jgi:hypothetical protein
MQSTIQQNSALFVNVGLLFRGSGGHFNLFLFTVTNVLALDLNSSQEARDQKDASV